MTDENAETISKGQAARICGVHTRTIGRWVEAGELVQLPDGTFLRDEVEDIADSRGAMAGNGTSATHIPGDVMQQGMTESQRHVENLLRLVERPIHQALDMLRSDNQLLSERIRAQEEVMLKSQELIGDVLLRNEERQAIRDESLAKRQAMGEAMKMVRTWGPHMMKQAMGKNPLTEFVGSMNSEERSQLGMLLMMFGERGEELLGMLETMDPEAVATARKVGVPTDDDAQEDETDA